jgi:spore coat protein U-like protein
MKSSTRFNKRRVKHVTTLGPGLLALGLVVAGPASAATDTDNIAVTGSVASSCTIAAGALAFDPYDPVTGVAVDGTATLTVSCAVGTPGVFITLGQGLHVATPSDTAPLRRMVHGTDITKFLSYNLYQLSDHATVWGNTVETAPTAFTSTGSNQEVTVFGRIAATQTTAQVGAYSDTVVATVNF